MKKEIDETERRERKRTVADTLPIHYRTKNQLIEENEELEIAGLIDAAKDLNDLKVLLREGRIKEFNELAKRHMRIKRSNPVVSKIKRSNYGGDNKIFEERPQVEKAISEYFTDIYRRPVDLMPEVGDNNKDEEMNSTTSMFTIEEIYIAAKSSYFNKGLGLDCFDGKILNSNE
jgi:hypothetical protein